MSSGTRCPLFAILATTLRGRQHLALSSTAYCIENSLTDDTYSVIISGVKTCALTAGVHTAFSFPEAKNFEPTRPRRPNRTNIMFTCKPLQNEHLRETGEGVPSARVTVDRS